MDIILVIVFYVLTANGAIEQEVYEVKAPYGYEQCEITAIIVKKDKYLNTEKSWVHSAECELRLKVEDRDD